MLIISGLENSYKALYCAVQFINKANKFEKKLASLQRKNTSLEEALADQNIYTNIVKLQKNIAYHNIIKQDIESIEAQWIEVSEALD